MEPFSCNLHEAWTLFNPSTIHHPLCRIRLPIVHSHMSIHYLNAFLKNVENIRFPKFLTCLLWAMFISLFLV
jgi:hypothetical protein